MVLVIGGDRDAKQSRIWRESLPVIHLAAALAIFSQAYAREGHGTPLRCSGTPTLVASANENDDHNDCSYVILYRSNGGRILFAGDSHDATWGHILANHRADVEDVEVLIAPHHGRASGRSYEFLDIVRPKLTVFGNANSEHLAYDAWNRRNLFKITNNQADCIVIDTNASQMQVYVTNETFAKAMNIGTWYNSELQAYYIGAIAASNKQAA
jgi:competence protein ComEC